MKSVRCFLLLLLACACCSCGGTPTPTRSPRPKTAAANSTQASASPEWVAPVGPGGGTGGASSQTDPARPTGTGVSANRPGTATNATPIANPSEPFKPDLADFIPPSAKNLPGFAVVKNTSIQTGGNENAKKGSAVFLQNCAPCHGTRGEGPKSARVSGRDLRRFYLYRYGSGDKAIFRTVKFGIPGTAMVGWDKQLTDSQIWDLVTFVKSLGANPLAK